MAVQHRRHRDDGVHRRRLMSRLKLAGQAGALVLVASLLVLLTWKVIQNDKKNVAQEFTSGKRPMAVDFNLERLNGPGPSASRRCAGRSSSSTSGPRGATRVRARLRASSRRSSAIEGASPLSASTRTISPAMPAPSSRVTASAIRTCATPPAASSTTTAGCRFRARSSSRRSGRVHGYIFGEARAEELESAIEEALAA